MVFATEALLQQHISDSLLTFAPSLLDIIQGSAPPSLAYFKSLPPYVNKCWAIYLIVFEKPSSHPRIYVSSGTNSVKGVDNRLQDYDRKTNVPRYVQQAFDDGYTITHKGLLCWASIPDVTIRFPVRVLFVLLEAIFSRRVLALRSQEKDYGIPRLSPWNAKDIAWDGCCSHSALLKAITGEDEGLTVEQITAKLVE
jgi:hypothetical protein